MIVIFSKETDLHALAVKIEIERLKNECYIIDTALYPEQIIFENKFGDQGQESSIFLRGREINISSISGVWRRRIYEHIVSPELEKIYREISRRDSKSALDGFFYVLADQNINILNNPNFETPALNKTYQLYLAKLHGLTVPNTLITTSEIAVKKFYSENNENIVFKAFNNPKDHIITTNLLFLDDLDRLNTLKYGPAIFQQYVKGRNLRVTYINGHVFAAEVLITNENASRDWRLEMNNEVIIYNLHDIDKAKIIAFMKASQLTYGALDFKLTQNNELIFLEVNPWGQYLFVEIQTGQEISHAIARYLISGE